MAKLQLDARKMQDTQGLHRESQRALGFGPDYGHNLDAWIDCVSGLREDEGLSNLQLRPDEALDLEVLAASTLPAPVRQQLEAAAAEVNLRCQESGQPALIRLHFLP